MTDCQEELVKENFHRQNDLSVRLPVGGRGAADLESRTIPGTVDQRQGIAAHFEMFLKCFPRSFDSLLDCYPLLPAFLLTWHRALITRKRQKNRPLLIRL